MAREKKNSSSRPDYVYIALVVALILIGLIALSSAGSVVGFERFDDTYFFLKRQLLYGLLLGGAACIVTSRVRYSWWEAHAFSFLIASVVLLLMVFVPGIGSSYGGASRWVGSGALSFQPTELVKLMFLLYLAALFAKRQQHIDDFSTGNAPFFIVLGMVLLLILLQPDLGSATVIATIAMAIYFAAGASWKYLAAIAGTGVFAVFLLIKTSSYRAARLTTFLHPELDPQGIGYHVNQALLAIGSGGLFGRGFGRSFQKFQYIPEVAGDSIFAVMSEELGFIIMVLFVALYLYFIYRGYYIARHAPDQFSKLIAVGITTWFAYQAFVNMGAMVAIMPLTGIPLPFISYGSSSLSVALASAGIMINISRYTKKT